VGRYAGRLVALARSRLPSALARHIDPEDVVQSACQSFFARARAGHYVFRRRGDLWRLLAAITLHKLRHEVERLTAAKRAGANEYHFAGESTLFRLGGRFFAREPSPPQAAALADTLRQVLAALRPLERCMVELRLEGNRLEEIAAQTRRSERTVRRVLEGVKGRLRQGGAEELGL
jgi:DNA-directed RNA polymerase specialized sigma24 family protein